MLGYEYINKLLKPFSKLSKARLPKANLITLKVGVTLVLTVTQVYVWERIRSHKSEYRSHVSQQITSELRQNFNISKELFVIRCATIDLTVQCVG